MKDQAFEKISDVGVPTVSASLYSHGCPLMLRSPMMDIGGFLFPLSLRLEFGDQIVDMLTEDVSKNMCLKNAEVTAVSRSKSPSIHVYACLICVCILTRQRGTSERHPAVPQKTHSS